MAFYTGQRHLRCNDHVIEKGGRHVAVVLALKLANHTPHYAKLKWLDTGWVSEDVDVDDLQLVQKEDTPR